MTERSIPAAVQAELERSASPDAILGFLTITHPSLSVPIRLVSDIFDYIYGGETYLGLPFDWRLVTDEDTAPTAQLMVSNIDRRIGAVLRQTSERPRLALVLLSSRDFDLSVVPRTALGTPSVIYQFSHFELSDVSADAVQLSGTIRLFDPTGEPWPAIRATARRCPGLFA